MDGLLSVFLTAEHELFFSDGFMTRARQIGAIQALGFTAIAKFLILMINAAGRQVSMKQA